MDDKIEAGNPPVHIDPKEHEAAMLAIRKIDVLGMAMPANVKPTPGLLSYLHDPARREFSWHREMRVRYGIDEANNGVSNKSYLANSQ